MLNSNTFSKYGYHAKYSPDTNYLEFSQCIGIYV